MNTGKFEFLMDEQVVLTITKDKRIVINPKLTEGEAAEKFWKILKDLMAKEDWSLEKAHVDQTKYDPKPGWRS